MSFTRLEIEIASAGGFRTDSMGHLKRLIHARNKQKTYPHAGSDHPTTGPAGLWRKAKMFCGAGWQVPPALPATGASLPRREAGCDLCWMRRWWWVVPVLPLQDPTTATSSTGSGMSFGDMLIGDFASGGLSAAGVPCYS